MLNTKLFIHFLKKLTFHKKNYKNLSNKLIRNFQIITNKTNRSMIKQ